MATANLSWSPTSGATSYMVQYKLVAAGSYTLYNAAIMATSVSITGLLDGTTYDFQVTSNCASGSAAGTVITGSTPCLDVSSLSVTFPTSTQATLSFTNTISAVSYTINYKLHSSSSYTAASGGNPLNNTGLPNPVTFTISGLIAGSAYDFQVIVNCVTGSSSGAITTGSTSCPAVTTVNVTFS